MKSKVLIAILLGAAISANAQQGYKDGIEYYKAGQYDNAIELLERNMNNPGTDKATSLYYLGQANLAKGDKAKAKSYFDQGIAADLDNAYNYVGIGAVELLNGQANVAKDNFKKAQSLAKKNAEVTIDIARAYYRADPTKYAKEIEEAVRKAHKDSKDKEPAIYVFEGDRKAADKDWGGAATEYEQAITFDEDNPEGYVKYANVYFNLNPDYAIGKLDELLKRRPESALGQRELAEKYYMNGKWTRAADLYGRYIANPNHFPEDKARYAVLLYAGQKYRDALNVSKEVLAQDPDNFQVQRIIVRSYDDLKEYPEALAASRKFFENPEFKGRYNASDYTTYAALLQRDSITAPEAIKVLELGNQALPKNSTILNGLSDYYFEQKDYVKSADYAEEAINAEENPSRSDLYNATGSFLGAASILRDTPDQAAVYAKRGVALVDRALEGYPEDQIPVRFLRRKALLLLAANNNTADEQVANVAQQMINRLNLDPKFADPADPSNDIKNYVDAYRWIAQYYASVNDTEKMDAAKAKQAEYEALLQK